MGVFPIVTWLALQAATPAHPTLSQVLALPLADRASLVLEFTDAVPHASLTAAPDNTSVTIETGPVGPVAAQDLESAPELKCIASVAVRGYRLSAGTLMRVLVRLRSPCQQKMRVTGRRIYLDLAPLQPSVSPSAVTSSSQPPAQRQPMPPGSAGAPPALQRTLPQQSVTQQSVTPQPAKQQPAKQQPATEQPTNRDSMARKPGSPQTAPPQSSPRPQTPPSQSAAPPRAASSTDAPPATGEEPTERAYRAFEADTLKRAKTLSAQGNVKGMQALRDEVIRRDAQLGRKRPDIITNLLNDLDRYTDEARAVRLKLDAQLFRKSQPG